MVVCTQTPCSSSSQQCQHTLRACTMVPALPDQGWTGWQQLLSVQLRLGTGSTAHGSLLPWLLPALPSHHSNKGL